MAHPENSKHVQKVALDDDQGKQRVHVAHVRSLFDTLLHSRNLTEIKVL